MKAIEKIFLIKELNIALRYAWQNSDSIYNKK
jgi:hypothetical protein